MFLDVSPDCFKNKQMLSQKLNLLEDKFNLTFFHTRRSLSYHGKQKMK